MASHLPERFAVARARAARKVPRLGLEDAGADAELDVVAPGTALGGFYRLSLNAIAPAAIAPGVLTPTDAAAHADRVDEPDFLGCGFVHIGVWGATTKEGSRW